MAIVREITADIAAGILVAGVTVAGEHPVHQTMEVEPKAKITPQTTCPVMGGKINKGLYVDHDGKRIYMCCKGCTAALKKDPKKYIKKLENQGVTLTKVQTICPVMGGKINKTLYVDHDGKRIYMCCKGCTKALKKDPKKYIKKLEKEGIVLDRTPTSQAEGKR